MLALLVCFHQVRSFEIGSTVFVNLSSANISTIQYSKARELAEHFDGKYAKIIAQKTNSHNHSKWVIQSLHNASIKLKIREQHVQLIELIAGPIKFHYIADHFSFEEFSLWREFRKTKRNMFLVLDTFTEDSFSCDRLVPIEFLHASLAFSFSAELKNSSGVQSAQAASDFCRLFYLSPEWMKSVYRTLRFNLRSDELRQYASAAAYVIESFELKQLVFHRALTAATNKMHRLAIRRPNITECEYYSLMKEVNAGIEEAESDQLRFYLSFTDSERRAFLGLILKAIDIKMNIFAKVHRLTGKGWTSANEEIAAKYVANNGTFETFHVIAHSPIDRQDWVVSEQQIRKWLFG